MRLLDASAVRAVAMMMAPMPDVMTIIPVYRRRRRIGDGTRVHAEHALDAPNDAADGCANDCADRPGDAATFLEAVRRTARDALRLRRQRHRSNS
jgi:hypothetical protein